MTNSLAAGISKPIPNSKNNTFSRSSLPSRQRRRRAASHGSARNIPDNRVAHSREGTLKLDLAKLDELIKRYENRPIEEFLTVWQKVSPVGDAANDASRIDAALVADYVARLRAPRDIEGVLTDLRNDKRVRARECIEIAARLAPTSRRPRSRNRALHAIRRHQGPVGPAANDAAMDVVRQLPKSKSARDRKGREPQD